MSFFGGSEKKKAVAYYRHSAEDKQENSVPLQRDFIRAFLQKHDVEILHEEADEGVSGLTANRPGFQRLFKDWITNPKAPRFDYVVVYDVSRWGRFEDPDEAGHYEFQCKQLGKEVVYARRGFPTDDLKSMSQVQTAFERWMSFQYSKKLSEDVIRGCLEISSQGYSVGGQAPYGLARLLLSSGDRKPIRIMEDGEHKSVANERITFVPKGDHTTENVEMIFRFFLDEELDFREIADQLNGLGRVSQMGTSWTRDKVYRILANPAYKGTLTYNKTWGRLKRKRRRNDESDWVIRHDAFPAIVESERFDKVQERLYWMLPSKFNKGYFALKKAKKVVLQEIHVMLEGNGIPGDYARLIPLSFAIKKVAHDNVRSWSFLDSHKIRKTGRAICVSVDAVSEDFVDRVFIIPSEAFGNLGMCIFDENEKSFENWLVKKENIESVILDFLDRNTRATASDEQHLSL